MTELSAMQNNVEIVGKLKTKDLEEKLQETTLKDGSKVQQTVIRGGVTVEFTDKQGNINNVRSQVFVGDIKRDGGHNKMFDSYKTILDEYKDQDNFGDEADIIRVTGEIQSNDYISQQGQQISNNRIRTRFINRLKDADKDIEGHAWATIEAYVDGFVDEMNAEAEPTGRKKTTLFTVGYGGRVYELQNVFVPELLVEKFEQVYYPGSTGEVTLSIKHFASVEEVKEDNSQLGFGEVKEVKAVTNYTDELWLTGGKIPFDEPKALDEEQISLLKKNRKEALASLDKNVPSQSAKPVQGFGAPAKSEKSVSDSPFKEESKTVTNPDQMQF